MVTKRWSLLLGLSLGIGLLAPATVLPQVRSMPADSIAWRNCQLPGFDGPARCAAHEVYEDRDARAGRRIPIRVAVLPATGDDVAPDPLFVLAGGPGQAATSLAGFVASELPELRETREIVLVDQRGTGASNPLVCHMPGSDDDPQGYLGPLFPLDSIRACRAELEPRADLTLYTTPIAMDDLDEIRAWLGYDRIDLYGTSYGTRAAQVYLRRHPDHVRALVLSGVVPMDYRMPLYHARGAQEALVGLFARCYAEAECQSAYPRLREDFQAVLDRLDEGPVDARVANPGTGQPVTLSLDRSTLGSTIRFMLYAPETARQIPSFVHRAAADSDYAPIVAFALAIRRALDGVVAMGMHLSVTCGEDVPFIDPGRIGPETRGTFLGDARVRGQIAACQLWPRGSLPDDYRRPVSSDAPVLMISGELDPVTPPYRSEEVARTLPNAVRVVVPGGGHSNPFPCVADLITRFVQAGTGAGLDTSCVNRIELPPFPMPSTE